MLLPMIERTVTLIEETLKKQIVLIIILILALSFLLMQVGNIAQVFIPTQTTEITRLLVGNLQAMEQLSTVNLTTKATVKVSKEREFLGLSLGSKNLIYEGVGNVQAGFDLSQMQIKELKPKQKIHLLLPSPQIVNTYLNLEESHIIDRYQKWFSPEGTGMTLEAQKEVFKLIKREACNEQILEAANQNAQQLIQKILKSQFENVIVKTQIENSSC
jgi:hypothetical protein